MNGNKIIFGWVYEVGTKKNQEKTQFASPTALLASLATQPRPLADQGVGFAGISLEHL